MPWPAENVAVLTHLRDPVDRFLSAYEFAIEVGPRPAACEGRQDAGARHAGRLVNTLPPVLVAAHLCVHMIVNARPRLQLTY